MPECFRVGHRSEVVVSRVVAFSPPAQRVSGIVFVLDRREQVEHVLGEEPVIAVSSGQHDRSEDREVRGIREKPCVPGDAIHAVIGIRIVDLALKRPDTDAPILLRFALLRAFQFRSGTVPFGEAVFKRIIRDVGKSQRFPEHFFEKSIEPHACDLFDAEAEDHEIEIAIEDLRAGLIHHGGLADHVESRLPRSIVRLGSDIEDIAVMGAPVPFPVIVAVVVVFRSCGKTALVAEKVPHGQVGLVLLIRRERDMGIACVGNIDGIVSEFVAQDVDDLRVEVDPAVRHQVLDREVHTEHLRDRGQVIEGVIRNGCRIDGVPDIVVGPYVPPGVLVDQAAILNDRDLRTRKSVLDIAADNGVDEPDGAFVDPHVLDRAADHDGERDLHLYFSFGKITELK